MAFIKNILNYALIVMLLVVGSGFTMSKHFCMGHMQSIAFFEKAHDCAEIMGMEQGAMDPMGCCDDVTQEIKIKDFSKTVFDFQSSTPQLIAVISHHTEYLNTFRLFSPAFYSKYKPPLIKQDIPVLIQSFLI